MIVTRTLVVETYLTVWDGDDEAAIQATAARLGQAVETVEQVLADRDDLAVALTLRAEG